MCMQLSRVELITDVTCYIDILKCDKITRHATYMGRISTVVRENRSLKPKDRGSNSFTTK